MDIAIIKADLSHLEPCIDIMLNSRLGEEYFPDRVYAVSWLNEGIEKEEIFVAIDEKKSCLGFIYYILKGVFNSFPCLELIAVREDLRGHGCGE